MTIQFNEQKMLTTEITDRQIEWISRFHEKARELYTVNQQRDYLESFMRKSVGNQAAIKLDLLKSESSLLPEKELAWISKDDSRLLRWLAVASQKPLDNHIPEIHLPTFNIPDDKPENTYHALIHVIDFWDAPLEIKRKLLKRAHSEWLQIQLEDVKLKWLTKENAIQMDWAWSYLNNYIKKNQLRTRRYHPNKPKDIHTTILSTFDNWTAEKLERYKLQTSMKQAWTQWKYRTNLKETNKKQSTYALSIESKKQLAALAKTNNVNLNQMLEYIIGEAYKNLKTGKKPKHPEQDSEL